MVFLIIYTTEMVLKIIAMGFFMRAHSYLRDAWNIVSLSSLILPNLIFLFCIAGLYRRYSRLGKFSSGSSKH